MWTSPRDCHRFLFCHFSLFLKSYYHTSAVLPTQGFLRALKSFLEPAVCLLEAASHSLNRYGFFCLICQKNIWNKVDGVVHHNLSPHPLPLSCGNYLLQEAFCLIRYEVNISHSEIVILQSLLCLWRRKWWLVRHCLCFYVFAILFKFGRLSFVLHAALLP